MAGTTEQQEAMRRVARLDAQFDRLLASTLTPQGRDYCKMMIDPFHDTTLNVVGLPDDYTGKSLVYDIRKEIPITKPSSLPAGAWDAHVVAFPSVLKWDKGGLASSCGSGTIHTDTGGSIFNELVIDQTGTLPEFPHYWPDNSPVVVNCVQSGEATFDPLSSDNADRWKGVGVLDAIDIEPNTKMRIIGLAFEVHNTTAALNRQGLVTCYRTGQEKTDYLLNVSNDTTTLGSFPWSVRSAPPTTVAYAQQLEGVSWKAEDGCLVISPIRFEDNNPASFNAELVALAARVASDGTTQVFVPAGICTISTEPTSVHGCASLEIPTSVAGAYFTGLSEETSLSLIVRAFVEVFPRFDSSDYALARPSPIFDQEVGPVIAQIQRAMLPGYPVGMNAKGDFFQSVVDKVKGAYRVGKMALGVAADLTGDPRLKAARAGISATEALAKDVKQLSKEVKKTAKGSKKK